MRRPGFNGLSHTRDWTVEDFQRVTYSDECSVEQQPAGQQRWVAGRRCHPVKHRQVKLMVWDCFWGKQRGPLVPLKTGSVNARVYRDLLRRRLLPVLEEVQAVVGNPLFQQDNAKIHTAKLMLSSFNRYAVPLESHPA